MTSEGTDCILSYKADNERSSDAQKSHNSSNKANSSSSSSKLMTGANGMCEGDE